MLRRGRAVADGVGHLVAAVVGEEASGSGGLGGVALLRAEVEEGRWGPRGKGRGQGSKGGKRAVAVVRIVTEG